MVCRSLSEQDRQYKYRSIELETTNGESHGNIKFDLEPVTKVTAAFGKEKWSVEGYLGKIGNVNLLAMNRKLHVGNAMVTSNLTLSQ